MSTIINKELADEKVSGGWLRAWLAFEALAVKADVTRSALDELVGRLDKDQRVKVYKKDFGDMVMRDKPLKNIEVGFSCTVEVELIAKNLEGLFQVVMEYGPSSVELLEPNKISVGAGEAQNIMNTVAAMMHRFAEAGLGGIVFVRGQEK